MGGEEGIGREERRREERRGEERGNRPAVAKVMECWPFET